MESGRPEQAGFKPVRQFAALTICVILSTWAGVADAQVTIGGTVRDASTRLPLVSTHVIVSGTSLGTITNHEGVFQLTVPAVPVTLVFRHLGYTIAQASIGRNDVRYVSVDLEPAIYPLPELLVVGDAFAAGVMSRVIARKAARRAHLPAYSSSGYSRITIERREQVVLVGEYVYDRYQDPNRGARHIIRSRRATADFHTQLRLTPEPQDLSYDRVSIGGLSFIGPTHPAALDHYVFTFAGRRQMGSNYVYDIYVAPKTNLEATFIGRIAVLDSVYALIEADLKPASHVTFGADVIDWNLFYRQQFAAVDSFWLPVDLFVEGRIHVEPDGAATAPAYVHQVAQLRSYELGISLPRDLYAHPATLQMDTLSVLLDDLFLLGQDQVALTPRELAALEAARGRPELTLRQALPATAKERGTEREAGVFAEGDPPQFVWPRFFGWAPNLRYNRVDGVLGGVGSAREVGGARRTEIAAGIAQSMGYGRTRLAIAARRWQSEKLAVTMKMERDIRPQQEPVIHSVAMNSLSARILRRDHFDWYWSNRARIAIQYGLGRLRLSMAGIADLQKPVDRQVSRPWPYKRSFAPNPAVGDRLNWALEMRLAAGSHWQPYHLSAHRRAEMRVEYGQGERGSGYMRGLLRADTYVTTYWRSRPRPARLLMRLMVGATLGSVPITRRHGLEGPMGPIAALGTLRSMPNGRLDGRHVAGLYWEHEFKSLLFEVLRLRGLAQAGVGIRVGGAHARLWPGEGWIHEATISLVRAPVRLDLTRGLSTPGWSITVGLAGRRLRTRSS